MLWFLVGSVLLISLVFYVVVFGGFCVAHLFSFVVKSVLFICFFCVEVCVAHLFSFVVKSVLLICLVLW